MKYLALLVLFFGLPTLHAQLTLNNGYFPQAGDSLLTNQAEDAYLEEVEFLAPGADLEWDFGYPEARSVYTEVVEPVVGDTVFTTADSRMTSAAFQYEYFQSTPTEYRLVGMVGSLPFFRDLVLSTPISPPRVLRRAGITYGDRFEDSSVRTMTMSVDSLPAEVRNSSVGAALSSFDSIRVTSTSVRQGIVDAWGTLTLEGYAYEVLRERREEVMETKLFVKVGQGPFLDITGTVLRADPSYGKYLGVQPMEGTYYFWAQDIKEPVVEIEFDVEGTPTTFLYKRDGLGTSLRPDPAVSAVAVYPNPVVGDFRIAFTLESAESVQLTLRDASGRTLREWAAEQRPAGEQWVAGSLDGYPRGSYLVELKTANGSIVKKIIK